MSHVVLNRNLLRTLPFALAMMCLIGCGGSGEVRRAARSMFGQFISVAPCPTCNGEGTVISEPCEVCRGEGRVRGERTVPVEVPAGVSGNNYLTLRGQGASGPRGGPSGDLLVMLDIKKDDRFERQGDDLIFDLSLSFSQAALGGEHEIPTPYGEESIKIVIEEDMAGRAARIEQHIHAALHSMAEEFEIIGDIRGRGVLVGIEFVTDREKKTPANAEVGNIAQYCLDHGLIFQLRGTRGDLNVIRLVPPMTTTEAEVDRAMSILRDAIVAVLS